MTENRPPNRILLHVRNFKKALEQYDGAVPLSKFLQVFFKQNKQMGSKDRKTTSRFLYHYFRLGSAFSELELVERLAVADFLCSNESDLVHEIFPEWSSLLGENLETKIEFLRTKLAFEPEMVFPFVEELSSTISIQDYCKGLLQQPALFIRVRKGKMHQVQLLLRGAGILYLQKNEICLELPAGSPLDRISGLKGLIEVQDFSSQKTLDGIEALSNEDWWDACSGAGGKSLLFLDRFPTINMMVSDKRASILKNLDERFDAAGIRDYRRKILDLAEDGHQILGDTQFDGIILDAPCTGSGTWTRTPEMIASFDKQQVVDFSNLQKQILKNALKYLKPGKILVYITCSVFKAENEDVVEAVSKENTEIQVLQTRYLEGYSEKADTMFVAHLSKI